MVFEEWCIEYRFIHIRGFSFFDIRRYKVAYKKIIYENIPFYNIFGTILTSALWFNELPTTNYRGEHYFDIHFE